MRFRIILFQITLFLPLVAFGQKALVNDIVATDSLRKGIYLNFREFRKNSPSDTNQFHFLKTDPKSVARGALPNFLYRVDSKTGKRDTIESGIWGFCNGKEIFTLVEGDSIIPSYYSKVLYVGRYCYYEDHLIYSVDAGGMLTANPVLKREKILSFIINVNNGKEFKVDDKLMGAILKDDPDVYSQYKKEKKRKLVYEKYIRMYSERNVDQIKK